ncbi:MAG: hypothetical protein LBK73_07320 [Treponema sp.]|jgi:hypothetical protein|nr:hypothetical protein [Treponema sp.]
MERTVTRDFTIFFMFLIRRDTVRRLPVWEPVALAGFYVFSSEKGQKTTIYGILQGYMAFRIIRIVKSPDSRPLSLKTG